MTNKRDEKRNHIMKKYGYSNGFLDPVDVNEHISLYVTSASDKNAAMSLAMGIVNFYANTIADLVLEYEEEIEELRNNVR